MFCFPLKAGSSLEFPSGLVPEDVDLEEGTGSYPSEPMLCSEAADGEIPHSLEMLYLSAECTSATDALIVLVHLLMMETGYVPQVGAQPIRKFLGQYEKAVEYCGNVGYKMHLKIHFWLCICQSAAGAAEVSASLICRTSKH